MNTVTVIPSWYGNVWLAPIVWDFVVDEVTLAMEVIISQPTVVAMANKNAFYRAVCLDE